jgi:DNA polymerase sigma
MHKCTLSEVLKRNSISLSGRSQPSRLLTTDPYSLALHTSSDIDLVILSNSMAYSDKVNVLHALANTIKRAGITSKVTIIAKAKVPIVKFISTHGRFNVDISINQANGVISGQIINGFLSDPHCGGMALRSLVMITKAFLSQRSMNEVFTGGLGSYGIVCLAVSFLQMHPKIRKGEIDAEKNLGVLVIEFFELYGCYFNYDEVGISVREGGSYFNKRQRGWHDYYKNNMLSIEDPVDPCEQQSILYSACRLILLPSE